MWQKNFCGKICRTNRKMVQTGGCCVAEEFLQEKRAGRKGVTTVWAKKWGTANCLSAPRCFVHVFFCCQCSAYQWVDIQRPIQRPELCGFI